MKFDFQFKLYVSGAFGIQLEQDLRKFFSATIGKNRYFIQTIDILANEKQAKQDCIIVTPTLIKLLPQPVIKIVCNMDDKKQLMTDLGIND